MIFTIKSAATDPTVTVTFSLKASEARELARWIREDAKWTYIRLRKNESFGECLAEGFEEAGKLEK